jgi:hypothetical protein
VQKRSEISAKVVGAFKMDDKITTHGAAGYPTEAMVRTGALLKPLRGAHGAFCGENRSKSYVEGCSYPKKRLLRILTASTSYTYYYC